jgi:hypothetical protein
MPRTVLVEINMIFNGWISMWQAKQTIQSHKLPVIQKYNYDLYFKQSSLSGLITVLYAST